MVAALPVGVTPAASDDAWWNSLPQGHRAQRIGVYLANLQVRVFTYDNATGVHFIGSTCPRLRTRGTGLSRALAVAYVAAATPKPVTMPGAPTERKTGLEPAVGPLHPTRPWRGPDEVRRAA